MNQRSALYSGVFLVAGAALVLQITLTRLYSAFFGHHLAFFAISLALFGLGSGGVLLYLFPQLARPPRLFARMAYLAGLAGILTVGSGIFLFTQEPIEHLDRPTLLRLAGVYLACSAPFTLIGIIVSAALKFGAKDVSRIYWIDLFGAALGGVLSIFALRWGAPRAVLLVGVSLGIASVLFALGSRSKVGPFSRDERPANPSVVAAFILSACVLFLGDLGDPWFDMPSLKHVEKKKVQFAKWGEQAYITVDRPVRGMAWMRMDGSAATAILSDKTRAPHHPDEMAYVLHKGEGDVLVIGPGGGRDIRAALDAGHTQVFAAEVNPVIVNDVMRGRYAEFSGGLYDKPGVQVSVADGRSYVRHSDRHYRNIVISLVDTWAAASIGALALSENSLYTVEGFADFVAKLDEGGTLTVNRWDDEFERLLGLASAALLYGGALDPKAHMFACSHSRSTALLIKRTPLLSDEIKRLRSHCKRKRYKEVFAPDIVRSTFNESIVEDPWGATNGELDISPPTDDRPFFFYTVPPNQLPKVLRNFDKLGVEHQGLLTLFALLLTSAAFGFVFLLVPLVVRPLGFLRARDRWPRLGALAFFASIGMGFVLIEVGLVQQFVMFLGHPIYSLSTVLTVLLVSAGVGSLLTHRVSPSLLHIVAGRRALTLVVVLSVYALGLGELLERAVSMSFAGRVVVAVAVLAPLGFLMGSQAPLAIRAIATRAESMVPWCWGLNGFASVVGTAFATLLAMNYGFAVLFLSAAGVYLLAAILSPRAVVGAAPVSQSTEAPGELNTASQLST